MFPQRSAEVAIDCCVVWSYRHPRFRNLNSFVPVNIVMVKSCASNLLNSTIIPVRVSVNKLDFVRKWIIATLSKPGRRPRRRQPKVTTAILKIIYIFILKSTWGRGVEFQHFGGVSRTWVCLVFYPFKPHSFEGESLLMSIALTLDHRDDFRFFFASFLWEKNKRPFLKPEEQSSRHGQKWVSLLKCNLFSGAQGKREVFASVDL